MSRPKSMSYFCDLFLVFIFIFIMINCVISRIKAILFFFAYCLEYVLLILDNVDEEWEQFSNS